MLLVNGRDEQEEGIAVPRLLSEKGTDHVALAPHLRWEWWRLGSPRCVESWQAASCIAQWKSRARIPNLELPSFHLQDELPEAVLLALHIAQDEVFIKRMRWGQKKPRVSSP